MNDEHSSSSSKSGKAKQIIRRTLPLIREARDTIDRHGGIEGVRDKMIEHANQAIRQVEQTVANASAIEGKVIEHSPQESQKQTVQYQRYSYNYLAASIIIGAAVYGALRMQSRT